MYAIRRHFKVLKNYSLNQSFSPFKYLYSSTCYPNFHLNNHILNSFHPFTSESNNSTNNSTKDTNTKDTPTNTTGTTTTNPTTTNPTTGTNNNNLECIESNIKNDRYIAVFTCNICNNRNAKSFSKQAYHHGIVYVKCESCNSLHLISDQLGWFGEKENIEEILLKKGQEASKMELGENVNDSDLQLILSLKHNKYFKQ